MWKIFLRIPSDKMYGHLGSKRLLLEEQKWCKRRWRGIKEQLLIVKMISRSLQEAI